MRHILLAVAVGAAAITVFARPPFAQPSGYHLMADERTLLGIPNALNVVSNILFAAVGLWGLAVMRRPAHAVGREAESAYAVLFVCLLLTSIGSSYYHLAPDNERLVWDRLPMAAGFMALLAAVVGERVHRRLGARLLVPLVVAGVASVVYWAWTEQRGVGDLRPYTFAQYGALALVLTILAVYPSRQPGGGFLVAAIAGYALAKLAERADAAIFSAGRVVSGHTMKHVIAAASVGLLVLMLRRRDSSRVAPAALHERVSVRSGSSGLS